MRDRDVTVDEVTAAMAASLDTPEGHGAAGERATRLWARGLLVLTMLIWGSTFVVTKSVLTELPPLLLAFVRFAIASAFILALARARGGFGPLPRPLPVRTIVSMGLTGVTLYYVGSNLSLVYTSASEAALVQAAIPALTAALAAIVLRERLGWLRTLGIGGSCAGVALVVLGGSQTATAPNPLLGDLLMLGACLSWAVYSVIGKRLDDAVRPALAAFGSFAGTLLLLPAAAYDVVVRPPSSISPGTALAVVYLGVVASGLGYLFWNGALRHLDASEAGSYINLIPVVGVAAAALVLGETPGLWQLLGGGLVVGGVWLSSR